MKFTNQYNTCFSDPTFDKLAQTFKYTITINDSEGNEVVEVQKTVEDLLSFLAALDTDSHYALFTNTSSLEYDDDLTYEECKTFKPVFQNALEEVLERRDIRSDYTVSKFCGGLPTMNDDLFPVTLLHKARLSEFLNTGDLAYDSENGLFFACLENSAALARAGRVWSLIDPEVNGTLRTFKFAGNSSKTVMPHFEKLMKKEYESRTQCCLYNSAIKTVYIGFNDGNICSFESSTTKAKDVRTTAKSIGDEPILGFQLADTKTGDIVLFTENNVKIVDAQCNVIGGGSLRKRLEGAFLTSFAVDEANKMIFLGSSEGKIYVYSYSKFQQVYTLKFHKDITVREGFAIECLQVANGHVICGCKLDINIYSYACAKGDITFKGLSQFSLGAQEKQKFTGDEHVTQVYLLKEKRAMISTYSNGLMLFWSTDSATVTGAMQAHDDSVIKLIVDEKSEMLITAGFNSFVRVWKYGLRSMSDIIISE